MSTDIELPDGFEFGFVKSDEELKELVQFNSSIHNELIANFLKRRLDCLPGFERRMNFYIRDCETGEIVSSMSAIPSTWEYEGIPLKNLEVDCVGTHKEYRNRGFIRYLYEYFDKELQNDDYHISTLQGIPEFFRQFGYDFLFPIGQFSRLTLRPDQVPRIWSDEQPQFMNLDIRDSTDSDLDNIIELYDDLGSRLMVRSFRTRELWEIQERTKKWRGFDFKTKLVIDDDQVVGYIRYIIR